MNKHVLSKTTFLLGVQCLKALYLNRFHPELKNKLTDEKRRIFETGQKVGKIAHELFPGGVGVDIRSFENLQRAVSYTEKLIGEGVKIIYEAAFQFDEVLVLTDILAKGNSGWKIYEVKSSTGMKPQYLLDTAVQYYVVSKSGLPIDNIFLVYVNSQYVRSGEIDVGEIFSLESVLEPVLAIQDHVKDIIPELKTVLQLDEIPHIDIGEYCHDPYECDFTRYCWEHVPENSVFELTRLGKKTQFELYRSGVLTLDQVPDDYPLSDSQRLQVQCFTTKTNHIDRKAIQAFLDGIHFPAHFLDFETYAPAIPLYDNTRPYQQIPFQYSLHVKEGEKTKLYHYEYLGMPQEDPRRELINHLLVDVRQKGSIIVYNRAFEVHILMELMQEFVEYEDELQRIIERISDLMVPFQQRYYYAPKMHGSYSIKAVLPVLVPDLDYSDLAVSDGSSAMYAYEQLLNETSKSIIRETRRNLLEYCKRDTMAMVRIFEMLRSI